MQPDFRLARRVAVLRQCGAGDDDLERLLAYTAPLPRGRGEELPLSDAPHLPVWIEYAADARIRGAIPALADHFPQLRFPISEGISADESYRAATRRGDFSAAEGFAPPVFESPETITLEIVPCAAGRVPVLTAGARGDFVTLVRAFTERNEPAVVPPSLGACLVRGLNNWSRVAAYRRAWHDAHPDADDAAWQGAFRTFAAEKPKYQDTVVILSSGPYSDLAASAVDLPANVWLERSLVIRRDHELTHFLTASVYGAIRRHFLDEALADFAGLRGAFGRYDAALALDLFGLDGTVRRPGARFELYEGEAPVGASARSVLAALLNRVAPALASIDRRWPATGDPSEDGRLLLALFSLTLEELAAGDVLALVQEALQ